MRVSFRSIELANFKCFVGKHKFALSGYEAGLHFLRGFNKANTRLGANGSGKSTVWGALSWCLWGSTVEGLRAPDIRPWHGGGSTAVTVVVEVDGKRRAVERRTNPNSLTVDGQEAGVGAVEALLGMSQPVFNHTILFGQGQPLFFDLPPKDRMGLFTEVLSLDRWDARSDRAARLVSDLSTEVVADEATLVGLADSVTELEKSLALATEQQDEWAASSSKRRKATEKEVATLTEQQKELRAKLGAAKLADDSAGMELRALQETRRKKSNEIRAVAATLVGAGKDESQAAARVLELENELAMFGGGKCPICGQPSKGSKVEKHEQELRQKIKAAKTAEAVAREESKVTALKVRGLESELARHDKDIGSFQRKADAASALVNTLQPSSSRVDADLNAALRRLTELEAERNPHREQVSDLKRRVSKLNAEYAELKESLLKKQASQERVKFWVKGFRDIRLLVVDEVLQELEMVTNDLLGEAGLVDWRVEFDTERETKKGTIQRALNTVIYSPANKGPVRWENWSGGEGQRLRIISGLALSQVLLSHGGVEPDLEVLDEPTQHLSMAGVRDLCDFLADRATALRKKIFYVDHMAVESSRFSTVTTVEKTKDGAEILFQ